MIAAELFADGLPPTPVWVTATGPEADIVISTRVRLARNVSGVPFPGNASPRDRQRLAGDLQRILAGLPALAGAAAVDLGALQPARHLAMSEVGLVAQRREPDGRGEMLTALPDLSTAVVVNRGDHLRIQVWRAGLDPEAALAGALAVDSQLEAHIEPAFSDDLGYLTASPTDLGTGLRVATVLHLPGLVLADEIEKVLNALRQLQFTVRGLSGDGGTVRGSLFVVSNLITLGLKESELIDDFRSNVAKIIAYERLAREQFFGRDQAALEDLVWRSLGVLAQARILSGQEAWDRISNVRLGVDLGILSGPRNDILNRAMLAARPGHLDLSAGRPLKGRERAEVRATALRPLFGAQGD